MRGLENRISHQNRQTRRSPAHSRHNKELRAEKAPQYAMCCDGNIRFPSLIADSSATHKAYPFPVRPNNRQNASESFPKISASVGPCNQFASRIPPKLLPLKSYAANSA
ncbi:hypothetical protein J2Y56_003831 [Pseudomonas sp. BE134]|nr:hypothetical protein [Pseudomonas sp. BE134]